MSLIYSTTLDPLVQAAREILVNAYVRVQAHHERRSPSSFTEDDRGSVKERFAPALEQEILMLKQVIHHARVEGIQEVSDALHSETGLEATDIIQAMEFARKKV